MPATPTRLVLTAALLLGLLTLPAGADDEVGEETDAGGCYERNEVEYCGHAVWFTPAETKAGNLGATGATGLPTWDDEEPSQSVTEGAGGGYLATGALRQTEGTMNPELVATFVGEHEGPLDNLDVTLYLFAPGRQTESTFSASATMTIGGQMIKQFDQADLTLEPAGDAVLRTRFVLRDLAARLASRGIDPDGVHEITLSVTGYAVATTNAVFVYDTTEVPSGMVFNSEVLPDGVRAF